MAVHDDEMTLDGIIVDKMTVCVREKECVCVRERERDRQTDRE